MSASTTNERIETAGVILAGGLSRRMFAAGTPDALPGAAHDKTLLRLGTVTMLDRVIARFRPQVSALALNANGDPARFAPFGLPVIADTVAGFVGPLAGVLAGMRWSRAVAPGVTHIVSVSSDAPFLPSDLVARLVDAALAHPEAIAMAQSGGELHPVIGCWPVALADDLDAALARGVRKVLAWTDLHGTIPVPFAFATVGGIRVDPFFNANTPEELAEARRLIAEEAS